MPEINKTLLRKVRNHILAEPRRYDQSATVEKVSKRKVPCGTQACILGWVALLSEEEIKPCDCGQSNCFLDLDQRTAGVLGLTPNEASVVYSDGGWPPEFQERLSSAVTSKERARAAADYINYIIRTGKVT